MNKATVAAKRWWYIMPIVFITYSLAYLDRANFSFASAAGINEDLGITKGMASLLGALFFLGYFFFQIPGAIYAERRSVKKLIFWCLILWGGCASLTGVVSNIPMLAAIRFILGVVEAAVMPAMLIYISNWFTKSERSRANTFLILGNPVTVLWMSVVSGYLIHAFGWREMFIIEGIPAVIWAFCWWVLAKDKPAQAGWLSADEKQALQQQLDEEQKGIKAVRNYGEAFRSRNVILLCVQYFAWSIGVYGFVLWLPSILRSGMQMGMAVGGALPGGDHRHDRGLLGVGQNAKPQAVCLAAAADRRAGVLRFLRRRRQPLLDLLRPAGGRRRRDVRPLRAVLRHHSGNAAEKRCRGRHGADQQHGRTGFVLRFVVRRLSEWRHRQPGGFLHVHGHRTGGGGGADADRQARPQRDPAAIGLIQLYFLSVNPTGGAPCPLWPSWSS